MNLMLCKESQEECHLNNCRACPGYYGDDGAFQELRYQFDLESTEKIKYKQWTSNVCKLYLEFNKEYMCLIEKSL